MPVYDAHTTVMGESLRAIQNERLLIGLLYIQLIKTTHIGEMDPIARAHDCGLEHVCFWQ